MRKVLFLLGRVWLAALAGVLAFFLLVDRKPMAVNIINHLQDTPRLLLAAVREKRPLCQKTAWESVQYYRDRLFLDPKDIGAMSSLGYIFEGMNEHSRALSMYQKALGSGPDLLGLRYNLALVHYKMGDIRQAYQVLSAVAKDQPVIMKEGFLCFFGGEPLAEGNLRKVLIKVSGIARLGEGASAEALASLFKGFFDDGLFYYVSVRGYQGRQGFVMF
jgi:tetratricopeptide (TPR) repeat protein